LQTWIFNAEVLARIESQNSRRRIEIRSGDGQMIVGAERSGRIAGGVAKRGALRGHLLRWPPGHEGGMNIFSPPRFLPCRWHHLVAQEANGQMELFVDGFQAGHARPDFFLDHCSAVAQFGTLHALPDRPKDMSRCFAGRMAEIALYDHPLSRDEILAHVRLGGVVSGEK
jgi:hypothetical protein